MCSISWLEKNDKLTLLFSRDEQRIRQKAIPPTLSKIKSVKSLMPIDPQGCGSWISVNQYGIVLGLLNFYQDKIDNSHQKNDFISRGLLIKELSYVSTLSELKLFFEKKNLKSYQPFHLVYISKKHKCRLSWNGENVFINELPRFYTSSSYQSNRALSVRGKAFYDSNPSTKNEMIKFHQQHFEEDEFLSLCLHRAEVKTVSLSVIEIDSKQALFTYWKGTPCRNTPMEPISLKLSA